MSIPGGAHGVLYGLGAGFLAPAYGADEEVGGGVPVSALPQGQEGAQGEHVDRVGVERTVALGEVVLQLGGEGRGLGEVSGGFGGAQCGVLVVEVGGRRRRPVRAAAGAGVRGMLRRGPVCR
ncbi:hypothetical protein [Streptomyces sp. NPDC058757]|uniref:hypothetical protein n=1 Tax=unclassified Streptomyces TaxID=2593676 RepID=UPI0036C54C9E